MTTSTCHPTRRPLLIWLARGGVGLALLAVAASTRELLVVVPALLAALIAFRGCPMCWTLGLIERGHQAFARPARKDAP